MTQSLYEAGLKNSKYQVACQPTTAISFLNTTFQIVSGSAKALAYRFSISFNDPQNYALPYSRRIQ